jgi:hypothetical protein
VVFPCHPWLAHPTIDRPGASRLDVRVRGPSCAERATWFLNFRETFIDNGSVDMLKAMRTYKEVGYDGMLMPDHVPAIEGLSSELGFAFAFGYIKALIAAVSARRLRTSAEMAARHASPLAHSLRANTCHNGKRTFDQAGADGY